MAKSKSSVDSARHDVERLAATVDRWEAQAAAKRAERADLEARMGDEVLADETAADGLAAQANQLDADIAVADRAVDAARRQHDTAERSLLSARAGELREQAERLRSEAAKRQRKTDKLLADLAEHEGCDYVPYVPSREQVQSAGAAGIRYKTPYTQRLLRQAEGCEQKASELDRQAENGPREQVAAAVSRLPEPASVS